MGDLVSVKFLVERSLRKFLLILSPSHRSKYWGVQYNFNLHSMVVIESNAHKEVLIHCAIIWTRCCRSWNLGMYYLIRIPLYFRTTSGLPTEYTNRELYTWPCAFSCCFKDKIKYSNQGYERNKSHNHN